MIDIKPFVESLDLSPRKACERLLLLFYGTSRFSKDPDIFLWQIRAIEWQLISIINLFSEFDEAQVIKISETCRSQELMGITPPLGVIKALIEKLISLKIKHDEKGY